MSLAASVCRDGWSCVNVWKHAITCGALHTSARAPLCKGRWTCMCHCMRRLLACFVSHLSTASACGGVCGTAGADIAVGGRGVSVQAAGYPIMSGLPLHPFPSNLPSSQHQREVSRGQTGPSLYHYPSITCHPPSADNRTFPPSLTLHSHHPPRLVMISHPSSFSLLL